MPSEIFAWAVLLMLVSDLHDDINLASTREVTDSLLLVGSGPNLSNVCRSNVTLCHANTVNATR